MAIRFVDVKPDEAEGAKAAPARRARAPEAAPGRSPEPARAEPEPDAPGPASAGAPPRGAQGAEGAENAQGVEPPLPVLPHAKPEPKPRGRKKPMSAVGADKQADHQAHRQGAPEKPDAPSAPLLEGLLPELQAHAKPTPKPRGRKKAFG